MFLVAHPTMSDWARWGDVGEEDEDEVQYEVVLFS